VSTGRLRRALAVIACAVIIAGLGAGAFAFECFEPDPPRSADAVFEGYVIDVQSASGTRIIRYQVLRAWKGVHADTIVIVRTPSDFLRGGGVLPPPHSSGMVYADKGLDQLFTDTCLIEYNVRNFAAFEPPLEIGKVRAGSLQPSSAAGAHSGGRPATHAPWVRWLAGCAVLTGILIALLRSRRSKA
jgi:hypothetical protein